MAALLQRLSPLTPPLAATAYDVLPLRPHSIDEQQARDKKRKWQPMGAS
jgi:hypothetical protein